MLISHTERGFKGRALLDILSFPCFTMKYCQIFLSAASSHVSPQRCSLLLWKLAVRELIWGYCMCSSISSRQEESSLNSLYCSCLDRTCITCLDISCLWDVPWANAQRSQLCETVRHNKTCQLHYMSMQRPFCPVFPCKPVMLIFPGNLFYSQSDDTFSHSSVITAYSQAIICTTCVWRHLGVFLPIISARDESHLQPSSSFNKSSSRNIKMIDG